MFKYLLMVFLLGISASVFAEFDWRDPTKPARYSFNAGSDFSSSEPSDAQAEPAPTVDSVTTDVQVLNVRQIVVGETRRFARINDTLVREGDEIMGYTVAAIKHYFVDLERENETKTLYLFEAGLKKYQN